MWDGKKKAITFSFDDGCQQDVELINLLNKYGIKATFNLNTGVAGLDLSFEQNGRMIKRNIVKLDEIAPRYKGHEVAVHTLHHPDLTSLSDEEVLKEINEDQVNLEKAVGYKIKGMAYPGGLYNDHLVDLIKSKTSIKYARTAAFSVDSFNIQNDLYRLNQFFWLNEGVDFDKLIDDFLRESNELKVLFIWGHSYEIDVYDNVLEKWEKLFQKLKDRDDVFFGTNSEVLNLN